MSLSYYSPLQRINLPPEQRVFAETVGHELAHFLQVITCSLVFLIALQLYEVIRHVVSRKPAITDIGELLHIALTPDDVAAFRKALTHLKQEEAGVTVEGLVESSAFWVQKRTHMPYLTVEEFERLLAKECPPAYHTPYHIAKSELGEGGYDFFNQLASLALCTVNPPSTLIQLAEEIRIRKIPLVRESYSVREHQQVMRIVADRSRKTFRGTPSDYLRQVDVPDHPCYTKAVRYLDTLRENGEWTVSEYLVPFPLNKFHFY